MSFVAKMRSFFKFDERNTNFKKEFMGGLVTFLAMSYILVVNPGIASGLFSDTPVAGIPYGGAFLATAVGSALATLLMAFLANMPIALAPGMGVNAFFVNIIISKKGFSWQEALAISFIGGLVFLAISFTKLRKTLIDAIPHDLKAAIGAGIGFFIALVGLRLGGVFTYSGGFSLGDLSSPVTLLSLFSILLIIIVFSIKGKISKFAFIISIFGTAFLGLILTYAFDVPGLPSFNEFNYDLLVSKDTWSVPFQGFITGFKTLFTHNILEIIILVYALLFVDIFDTAGTLVAVGKAANLEDENGEIPNMEKAMKCDAIGTLISSTLGTPEITSYVESATGVEAGARTGFSNVVIALFFLLSIALFPIFNVFSHSSVTVGALVLVGVLMATQIKEINWSNMTSAIAAFVTIMGMIITGSIAEGISFGFIIYVIIKLVRGEFKELHPILYGSAALFIVYYVVSTQMLS